MAHRSIAANTFMAKFYYGSPGNAILRLVDSTSVWSWHRTPAYEPGGRFTTVKVIWEGCSLEWCTALCATTPCASS